MELAVVNKEIENYPSLKQAFMAGLEGIEEMSVLQRNLEKEIEEQNKKIDVARDLNMPIQGLVRRKNNLLRKMNQSRRIQESYKQGYLEIPNLGQGWYMQNGKGDFWMAIDSNAPLRVFEALKEAKEKELFDDFVTIKNASSDPVIVGRIGRRNFYITSWR